ncbi:MAG: elongation factor G [Planctomycetota bacterium]|jgi:elongation factor G|nr:elongation factor G [Planctomycetota bacterium]
MAKYKSSDIRNIALAGHSGSGKTILAEAMLLKAGQISRLGSISDGTTVSDYEKEEKEYRYSLNASVLHLTHAGREINLVDTPGQMDFQGAMIGGLTGVDSVVICVNAQRGIELMTRKAWDVANRLGLGKIIAITRSDAENVNLPEVFANIQKVFGSKCALFTIPQGEGAGFQGVTSILAGNPGPEAAGLLARVKESAIEADDTLMEKYLENGDVSPEEFQNVLPKAILAGTVIPVFHLAAEKNLGVSELMDALVAITPSPLASRRLLVINDSSDTVPLEAKEDGPLLAQAFKVVSDPHVGKLCFLRVFSGKLESKTQANVSGTGRPEKFAQLVRVNGEKREDIAEAVTGDIVGVAKVDNLHLGDTVYHSGDLRFPPPPFPTPMTGLAISPRNRGDEQKMGANLHRLCEEDPTFQFARSEQTGEQVIRGLSQVHLDVMLSRLKTRYGMELDTKPPKIPYLETITRESEGSYRHKKQSGGAGQFGEVHLRIKPNERGGGFQFVNAIVGGVISGPFIPSVEKGVKKALEKGPVAGFPLVDVVVELFFGKEHPVDSKDIAFQIAGEMGFREIVAGCKPVLLEPIVNLEIVFPAQYFGDISGDISSRRGRPTGTDQLGDMQVLKAQAPLAEVADYGSTLKAITQGEGSYGIELSHYEAVPANIAQQVAQKARSMQEEKGTSSKTSARS